MPVPCSLALGVEEVGVGSLHDVGGAFTAPRLFIGLLGGGVIVCAVLAPERKRNFKFITQNSKALTQ